MNERSRARVLAGSMSAITAAAVAAALLGASVAVTIGFGIRAGGAFGTLQLGSGRGRAASAASRAASARNAGLLRRSAAAHPAPGSDSGRPHRRSSSDTAQPRRLPPFGHGSSDVGGSVSAGPARASASAGSDGVAVTAQAGPVKKTVKVCTPLSC